MKLPIRYDNHNSPAYIELTQEAITAIAMEIAKILANTSLEKVPTGKATDCLSDVKPPMNDGCNRLDGSCGMCPLDGSDCTKECGYPDYTFKCPYRAKF